MLGQGHGRGLDRGLGVLYLFTTAMQGGILGALMTFSPVPWYPAYETTVAAWGLTPLEDQQLAGLLMWIPAGAILTATGVALFAAWLGEAERRLRASPRRVESSGDGPVLHTPGLER